METLRESLLEKGVEIGQLSVHMETYMKKNSENRSHHQQPGPSYKKKSVAQSEEDYDIHQKMTAAVHMAGGHHVNIII